MARTALSVQQVVRTGLTPSYGAANGSGGHSLPNSGVEMVHVKTGGTGCVVTIQTPGTVDGLAVPDRTITIGTNSERMIGPFPPGVYNQADGSIYIDFDSVTTVTIAAIRPV
jgi:hypothetical protein